VFPTVPELPVIDTDGSLGFGTSTLGTKELVLVGPFWP
jgi:hypothetical protein